MARGTLCALLLLGLMGAVAACGNSIDMSKCDERLDELTTDEAQKKLGAPTGGGSPGCYWFANDVWVDEYCVCSSDWNQQEDGEPGTVWNCRPDDHRCM
jgi:hypothetical protein